MAIMTPLIFEYHYGQDLYIVFIHITTYTHNSVVKPDFLVTGHS